jgi:hypothetical protein
MMKTTKTQRIFLLHAQQPKNLISAQRPKNLISAQQPKNLISAQRPKNLISAQRPKNLISAQQPKKKIKYQVLGKTALTERVEISQGKLGRRAAGATPGINQTTDRVLNGRRICRPCWGSILLVDLPGATLTAAAVKLAPGYPLPALSERSFPRLGI